MLARPGIQSYRYSFAGSITLVFASGVGLCLGQPQLRGELRAATDGSAVHPAIPLAVVILIAGPLIESAAAIGVSDEERGAAIRFVPSAQMPLAVERGIVAVGVEASATVGASIDVYALGMILYELLAGRLLSDESTYTFAEIEELKRNDRRPEAPPAVAARSPRAGESRNRSRWRDLDAICLAAMESDVNRRYNSVEGLLQDLRRFAGQEPLRARAPPSWTHRAEKFVRRRRVALLVAAGVFVTITGLAGFFTRRLAIERGTARAKAGRSKRIEGFGQLFQGGQGDVG